MFMWRSISRFLALSSGKALIVLCSFCSCPADVPPSSASTGCSPPLLLISSIAARYSFSSRSRSEVTVVKAAPPCSAQKPSAAPKSCVCCAFRPSCSAGSTTQFSRRSSRSWQSAEYDQPCCSMTPNSEARSKSTRSGRCSAAADESVEKSTACEPIRSRSCSARPTFSAIICAGPLRGKRRIGMTPSVTSTEKTPETIAATAASTSASASAPDGEAAESVAYLPGSCSEKKSSSSDEKLRCSSLTRDTSATDSELSVETARLSSSARGIDGVKCRWKPSYSDAAQSSPMRCTFSAVGCTK
mmetsp:Transcript_2579/g.5825  ORF Transcript_2579/g.5825 Transcript_2579/m.5825 type:complete len:301 (+) Transcript_2579:423-1325(+)